MTGVELEINSLPNAYVEMARLRQKKELNGHQWCGVGAGKLEYRCLGHEFIVFLGAHFFYTRIFVSNLT